MARQKVMMQNITTVTSAPTVQAGTDVVRLGNNRTGVIFLDIYASGGAGSIFIQTTDDEVNGSSAPTSPDTWITVGIFSSFGAGAASFKVAVTDLGESLRWKVNSVTTSVTFRLIAFLADTT